MQAENVLAIDVGTQSARALAFDRQGHLVAGAQEIYPQPYLSPRPGWAEQDPEVYWQAVGRACRRLAQEVPPRSLAALALSCQRGTVVNLDARGEPLRPAIVWLDQRRAHDLPTLPPLWRFLFTLAGARGTVAQLLAQAEVNWLREQQPQLWQATARYLLLSGYLHWKFTGEFRDSVACQVGYLPFDAKRLTWERPGSWKWRALPIAPYQLPDLVPPGERLGVLTGDAAEHLGLPEGLPVIAGASDKACEVLGCGSLESHQGVIGFGTTATLNVSSARYREPIRLLPPYPGARSGAWNLEFQIFRGFWMVTWFKEQFAQLEAAHAEELGVSTEQLLETRAAEVPPGSLGLTLQPYWTPGLRHPGLEAKGAILGFGDAHHKPHLYRALLEGLAYAMREGRERLARRTGTPITHLTVCGGGSRSDLVLQITADVMSLPAHRPSLDEASGLGAAVLAAQGAGLHEDLPAATKAMTSPGRRFDPNPQAAALYDRLYRRVYRRMYRRMRPLYREIMEITGYPAAPGE